MGGEVPERAAELAAELIDDGVVILPRSEVNRRVKASLEAEGIAHEAVREGFESAGWEYSRHVYFHGERFREAAIELAVELAAENHLLVAEEEVMDRIAEPIERGDEAGWQRGKAVAVLRDAFGEEGWLVREVERGESSRVLYLLPLFEVIRELHPNGRPPLSTDDLFRYYVAESIEGTVGRDG